MPFFYLFDEKRIDFKDPISVAEVEYLVAYKPIEVLQCQVPVQESTWDVLNGLFFRRRPEVQLRVYSFYEACDLSFAARMDQVRNFSADCLLSAHGVEAVAAMQNLDSLSIGIYDLDSFGFLWQVTDKLRRLMLGATRSKRPDLLPLIRFGALTHLFLEGQQKNIAVLSELTGLEEITLRSISTPGLGYLLGLPKLGSLDVKLGGIRDLSAIAGMETLKRLELWQVRGLTDVGVISHLPGLQYLFLQSLPLIIALPPLRGARSLRRVVLQNLKGLRDLSELEWAPALEDFSLAQGDRQEPEDLLPLLRNTNLRRAAALFGSTAKNKRFAQLRDSHGIGGWIPGPFQYH